ncbi:MAG: non-hydrolyzing UDP-N-acetylglucosamine 2-epimerase [Alkalispirochaetaceae bacterium]
MLVYGTRPEAIKLAPLHLAARRREDLEIIHCSTGQHREMLDQVLSLFEITPDHDLAVMAPNQDLFDVTSKVLLGLREVLRKEKPDAVVVQGDTTSCFVGALAAFYENIPIGHVEAGLRTWNLRAPFPEEGNRVLTSRIATHHFPPTPWAAENLLNEQVPDERVHVTGNTVIDALLWVREKVEALGPGALSSLEPVRELLEEELPYVLITGHRRENFGEGFQAICRALRRLAEAHPSWAFIYPVHLNPNVRGPVYQTLGDLENVILLKPQEYAPFVLLMDRSRIILTDSGGVQEEAPSLGKPVLVMREVTERPEAVEAGTVRLVGTDEEKIVSEVTALVEDPELYQRMAQAHNPYGDGQASKRILDLLVQEL